MAPIARRWILVLLALAWALPVQAEADRAAVVARLMDLSGVDRQMDSFAGNIADQILAQGSGSPAQEIRVALADAARTEYAEAFLLGDVRRELLAHYDAGRMAAVLRWLVSPTGRRMTALEERASAELERTGIEEQARRLAVQPPQPDRIRLIQELDQSLKSTAHATDVVLAMTHATARAFNAVGRSPMPEDRLRASIEAQRAEVHHAIADAVFTTLLMTYATATDADLNAYIAFSRTPEGRWYTDTMSQALLVAMENAANRTAGSAARIVSRPAAIGGR